MKGSWPGETSAFSIIVTSSGTDKKLEIDRKLENKLEIFEFFVNGR